MKFVTEIEVEDERLVDLLTTAIEGGIGYWARTYEYRWDCPPAEAKAVIVEFEEAIIGLELDGTSYEALDLCYEVSPLEVVDWKHTLTIESLGLAVQRALQGEHGGVVRRHALDFLEENEDSITADVIAQIACFGEVRYG